MKTIIALAVASQLSAVALAQAVSSSTLPAAAQIVVVRSGQLHLKGYFWKPGWSRTVSSYLVQSWIWG